MARNTPGNTSNYLSNTTAAPVGNPPFSIACWCNFSAFPSGSNVAAILTLVSITSNVSYATFGLWMNSSKEPYTDIYSYPSSANSITSASSVSASTWFHMLLTASSGGLFTLYVNGTSVGSVSYSVGSHSLNTIYLGAVNASGTISYPSQGSFAEGTVWNIDLTANEAKALALGVRSNRLRPASLKAYWPLFGLQSPEPDLSGNGYNLTITGSVPQANHAPVTTFTKKVPLPSQPSRLPYPVLISNPGPQYAWYE